MASQAVEHRREAAQQELLEEPGNMGAMPFRGTGVGHRLHHLVLGGKRRGPAFRFSPHRAKGLEPDPAGIAGKFGDLRTVGGLIVQSSGGTRHYIQAQKTKDRQ